MAHLLRPSAQRDARLVVPTDRQPNSPHAAWQAGAVTAPLVEDQMLIATRSGRSAATHPPRKDCLSLNSIMTQTYKLTSRSALNTVTHFSVRYGQHRRAGQCFTGRDLSFVTA